MQTTSRRNWLKAAGVTLAGLAARPSAGVASPLSEDRHRPQYHLIAPCYYMNDPNGPLCWKGKVHLFYQYNPNAAVSASKHWAHAVSDDFVHWKHLPIALAPTPGGPDQDGVFTGSVVVDGGVPTAVFTGVRPEVQMIATALDDNLIHWQKYKGNPVVAAPPSGLSVTGFRDPCVWREGNQWMIAVGSGIVGKGGAALLYSSSDLRHWTYLHSLYTGRIETDGPMWNCPDFFPLGGKHILNVSIGGGRQYGGTPYWIGTYQNQLFQPESRFDRDLGCSYAPKTMLDGRNRRISFTWLREKRTREAQIEAGWSGVMSIPRLLTLKDEELHIEPIPELQQLRGPKTRLTNLNIRANTTRWLSNVQGDCLEITAELALGAAGEAGLILRSTADGEEQTRLLWRKTDGMLVLDTSKASLNKDCTGTIEKFPLKLLPHETLKLHIFLDASVIEVFANSRACISDRVYPSRLDAAAVGIFAMGGPVKLKIWNSWRLNPISPDRMTDLEAGPHPQIGARRRTL